MNYLYINMYGYDSLYLKSPNKLFDYNDALELF